LRLSIAKIIIILIFKRLTYFIYIEADGTPFDVVANITENDEFFVTWKTEEQIKALRFGLYYFMNDSTSYEYIFSTGSIS
jgi:hypothetical protein